MSNPEHDKILAFDTLFTNNHIQMMKIVMPLFDARMQKYMAIYIKYMEFQYTLSYFKSHPYPPFPQSEDPEEICLNILPYCSSEEKKKVEQIQNMFTTMKSYKEMMEMFSMMKELFPEGEGGMNADMISGMFGQDMNMSNIFDMFSSMNAGSPDTSEPAAE